MASPAGTTAMPGGWLGPCKYFCCTIEGLMKLKKFGTLVCGGAIITTSLITFIIPGQVFNLLLMIRTAWNLLFGILMVLVQFKCSKLYSKKFGFLRGWFGRGFFFMFVGTNVMTWCSDDGGDGCNPSPSDLLNVAVGSVTLFVGVLELLFGFRCQGENHGYDDDNDSHSSAPSRFGFGRSGGADPHAQPTFTVNVTPGQAAQAASFVANNAGAAAAAAAPSASGGDGTSGGAAPNPFFGNKHLGNTA